MFGSLLHLGHAIYISCNILKNATKIMLEFFFFYTINTVEFIEIPPSASLVTPRLTTSELMLNKTKISHFPWSVIQKILNCALVSSVCASQLFSNALKKRLVLWKVCFFQKCKKMTCSSNKQVVYCIILHVSNSKMFKKQLLFVFLTLKPLVRAAEESLISAGEKNTIPSSSLEQIFLSLRRRD